MFRPMHRADDRNLGSSSYWTLNVFCHLYWFDKWIWIPRSVQWEKYQPYLCFQIHRSPAFCLNILYPHSEVKVTQSCLTLCNPMDYTVHGIVQARLPEWVAFPFSRGSSQSRDRTQVSHIAGRFFTSWATREAQEYFLHCRQILYQLSYEGSCVILSPLETFQGRVVEAITFNSPS